MNGGLSVVQVRGNDCIIRERVSQDRFGLSLKQRQLSNVVLAQ